MRSDVKSAKTILKEFDVECSELCYTDFIPNRVTEARERLRKAMNQEPSKVENLKEQLMYSLRNAFNPDKYDLSLASFARNGERVYLS